MHLKVYSKNNSGSSFLHVSILLRFLLLIIWILKILLFKCLCGNKHRKIVFDHISIKQHFLANEFIPKAEMSANAYPKYF